MEATIQSNQMDVDKEEARPNPEVSNHPQERHIWRMPEFPPIPQEQPKKRSEKYAQAFGRGHELLLTHQELSGSGEDNRTLRRFEPMSCKDKDKNIKNWLKSQSILSIDQKKEFEMTPALETEGPVASTSSNPAPEVSKDKPKGPQKQQKVPKNH
ncbi:hypothetical protein O181_058878 [Austropuccinia psidii MF-1]|uniref:Uncharacterized protein n=1 Tax=Austropuccinia psidii MF-1 TaxID=1389203 RepID=A0A9Q3EHS3_9BASI|nr:hypothetical protein [Austropuccinia psidii MF-1]